MNRYILPFVALLASTPLHSHAENSEDLTTEARQIVKQFGSRLKSTLQTGMQAGGPLGAIDSCNLQAGDIADQVSQLNGWQVGRTSLKTRNAGNTADTWELRILKDFDQQKANGVDPKGLEASTIIDGVTGRQFRYMKAIPTAGLCLNCHGSELAPAVASKLDALYPDDQARGYQQGEIRGAFTLTRDLD